VGADGGLASGRVGVERDEDPGAGHVSGTAEYRSLPNGQGGAAGRESRVPARVGDRDGDGVERALHNDGDGPLREVRARTVQAEQYRGFRRRTEGRTMIP